ncbi:MAG TPA: HD domain-containing phosphohydrolase [Nevskiaceae bacterium]|nr:HD domain-containing phosphohydrolase [Nevskiaceae bacterium]
MNASRRPVVLVVDDTPLNLQVATTVLREHYVALAATDGFKALELVERREDIDLVLLDVMMPELDGYEVCRRLRALPGRRSLPVIFLTALDAAEDEKRAFETGGVDFVSKPFRPETLLARVATHLRLYEHERRLDRLVRERTAALERKTEELEQTRLQVIHQLGRAAEFKDDDTGTHVIRMSHYARLIAEGAGFSADQVDLLFKASPMHDIGKLGIPDAILQKPGPLTPAEWTIMQRHPAIGAGIIGRNQGELLECARLVALTHHEKWDGSGYPRGRAGTDIPIQGRVVAIADVFDALTSARPYKQAWSIEAALDWMRAHSGRTFDPGLLPVFFERLPEILAVRERYREGITPL